MVSSPYKHKLRHEIVDDLADINISDPICMEVDQTGMELHERSTKKIANEGLLSPWLNVFDKIRGRISHCAQCEDMVHHFVRMMRFDYKGISMKMRIYENGRPTWAELRFGDFYMTSGWRFTSTINFLVETVVTHTCLARNVADFYKHLGSMGNGTCVMEEFRFFSWNSVVFRMSTRTEGDGHSLVVTTDSFRKRLNYGQILRAWHGNFGERAEFVGLHCLMTNTGVSRSWCPDLLRTLTKLCVTLGREDYLSIAVSRYCSFSLMCTCVGRSCCHVPQIGYRLCKPVYTS